MLGSSTVSTFAGTTGAMGIDGGASDCATMGIGKVVTVDGTATCGTAAVGIPSCMLGSSSVPIVAGSACAIGIDDGANVCTTWGIGMLVIDAGATHGDCGIDSPCMFKFAIEEETTGGRPAGRKVVIGEGNGSKVR